MIADCNLGGNFIRDRIKPTVSDSYTKITGIAHAQLPKQWFIKFTFFKRSLTNFNESMRENLSKK